MVGRITLRAENRAGIVVFVPALPYVVLAHSSMGNNGPFCFGKAGTQVRRDPHTDTSKRIKVSDKLMCQGRD